MKTETITLKVGDATIKMPAASVAQFALAAVLTKITPQPAINAASMAEFAPAIGEYWPGEGGINGGFFGAREGVPAHFLIFAEKDLGEFKWGRYEQKSKAASKWNGKANTDALIAAGEHPAAEAARAYTADGHSDFDLPAAAQLYHAWAHDLISKGAYWSSSQRSAYYAFIQHFVDGLQYGSCKGDALRVRPVRMKFI